MNGYKKRHEKPRSKKKQVRTGRRNIDLQAHGLLHADTPPWSHALNHCAVKLSPKSGRPNDICMDFGLSYRHFYDLYKLAPAGYVFLDKDCRITDINIAGAQIMGMRHLRLINQSFEQFIMEEDRPGFREMLNKLLSGHGFSSEKLRLSIPGDHVVIIRISSVLLTAVDNNSPDEDGVQTRLLFTFSDVSNVSDNQTDDSQNQPPGAGPCKFLGNCSNTVFESGGFSCNTGITKGFCTGREKLRLLSHETMALLENERKIIAKDIHDSLGGSLAAIKFLMEDILSENCDHPEVVHPLNQTIKHIQDAIKQTKRISAELRPTILDDLGLEATIKGFCRNLKESFPNISFMIETRLNEETIDDSLKIFIYRIIQEAMTNAVTHSRAERIWMSLVQRTNEIRIEVKDNGRGFDIKKISTGPFPVDGFGHGLTGVREKAEICGGSFFIKSLKDQGTCLTVYVPLEKDHNTGK